MESRASRRTCPFSCTHFLMSQDLSLICSVLWADVWHLTCQSRRVPYKMCQIGWPKGQFLGYAKMTIPFWMVISMVDISFHLIFRVENPRLILFRILDKKIFAILSPLARALCLQFRFILGFKKKILITCRHWIANLLSFPNRQHEISGLGFYRWSFQWNYFNHHIKLFSYKYEK